MSLGTASIVCCEPTYKELKRWIFGLKQTVLPGCEPTYKELKPFLALVCIVILLVASLPIRN